MHLTSVFATFFIVIDLRKTTAYDIWQIVETEKPITSEKMYADYPQLRELDMSNQTTFEFPLHQVLLDHDQLIAYMCNNCGVKSIYNQTFSKLPQLTVLELKNNSLEYVHPDSFERNDRLDKIDFTENKLITFNSEATLRHISSLSILNLSQNRHLDINRVKLQSDRLLILSCNKCATTFLDRNSLVDMPRLSQVNFRENFIEQIYYDAMASLSYFKTFNIDGNRNLQTLSFTSKSLKRLSAENCSLEGTLQTSNLPELKSINVRGNRITHLDELSLLANQKINTLLLDNNELEKIPEKLMMLPQLQRLCLDQNQLQPYENTKDAIFVYKSRFLRYDCSQDGVFHHNFEYNLPSERGLAVYKKNPVHSVANNGATIDLSGRNIVFIEQDYLVDYEKVLEIFFDNNFKFNFIESKIFLESHSVETLFIRNCSITALYSTTFEKLPKLTTLHLQGNQIQTLDSSSFSHKKLPGHGLTFIDLASNNLQLISATAFQHLQELKVLILDDNGHLSNTTGKHFLRSTSISNLSCENCGFEHLTDETFSMMPSLRTLNLRSNALKTFDTDLLNKLETLCIDDTFLENATRREVESDISRVTKLEKHCKEQKLSERLREEYNKMPATTIVATKNIQEASISRRSSAIIDLTSTGHINGIGILVLLVSMVVHSSVVFRVFSNTAP